MAYTENSVNVFSGTPQNDPRMIRQRLKKEGLNVWLDIEQLESGEQGLFEELAQVSDYNRLA